MTDMTKANQPQDQRELLLTQHEHDRTLYELPGVGILRTGGYFGGTGANITVGHTTWQCRSMGVLARKFVAVGVDGTIALQYFTPLLRPSAGTIPWGDRALRYATVGHGTHQLTENGTLLATFSGLKDNRTPVRVTLAVDDLPPALIMFATYLARDRQRRAVGAGTAGASSSGGDVVGSGCSSGCSTGCSGGSSSSGCSGGGGCGGGGCGGGS